MKTFLKVPMVALIAAFSLIGSAHAQTNLGAAQDYNLFIFRNHTQSGTDVQGRVAVGGNASYGSGMNIASSINPASSAPSLIVGGNFSNTNNTVNGPMIVGGKTSWNNPTLNGSLKSGSVEFSGYGTVNGSVTYGTSFSNPHTTISGKVTQGSIPSPINFGAAYTQLNGLSTSLAAYVPTGLVTNAYNNLRLTGTGRNFEVFNVSAAQLSSANYFGFEGPFSSSATVVVNITGANVSASNFGFNFGSVDTSHILFNFSDAVTLSSANIGWSGAILAPKAEISTSYGQFNGTVIAHDLSGTAETHLSAFKGTLPCGTSVAEEPAVVLLMAGCLPFGALVLMRKQYRLCPVR